LVNRDISNHEKALLVAEAYLIEAYSDFEAVDTLIEYSKYNLAVYHAQQAVEKISFLYPNRLLKKEI